ncbi:MAG: BON domain-containing protein [Candidatus Competibacteraceae bacterium]|nr:BON domain-containing protein [Candidatus Competibacteraceae bacterium]
MPRRSKDAFKQDPQLATASITVTVEKGVVTLSGNAPNAQTYNRAISVARSAPGSTPTGGRHRPKILAPGSALQFLQR